MYNEKISNVGKVSTLKMKYIFRVAMKIIPATLAVLLVTGLEYAKTDSAGFLEKLDPAVETIVSPDSTVETLTELPETQHADGAVWVTAGFLLYSDASARTIWSWNSAHGPAVFLKEHGADGLVLDTRGRLTVADRKAGKIWRLEGVSQQLKWASPEHSISIPYQRNTRFTVLADQYKGSALNGPTDLVYKSDGSIYFTDRCGSGSSNGGVYRLVSAVGQPSGTPPRRDNLSLMPTKLSDPAGLAFSPTETFLYVSSAGAKNVLMQYPLTHDGDIAAAGSVIAELGSDTPSGPSSVKTDIAGNIYAAGRGGVWLFSPEGKHVGTIHVAKPVRTIVFGSPDGKTLYLTTDHAILSVKVKTLGLEKKWLVVPS